MLTAANRTTKKTQEVLATSNGELVTIPASAKVQVLSDTGSISGAIHLCGMIVIAGADAAQMNITSGGTTIFAWKTAASTVGGLVLPYPVYCANGVTCTRVSGTSPTFIIYYVEA